MYRCSTYSWSIDHESPIEGEAKVLPLIPWVVVGDTAMVLAQSALPNAPQVAPRSATRRRWVHRISQRRS